MPSFIATKKRRKEREEYLSFDLTECDVFPSAPVGAQKHREPIYLSAYGLNDMNSNLYKYNYVSLFPIDQLVQIIRSTSIDFLLCVIAE